MGEPLPGDIPDPTHLKTQNVLLAASQVAKKGDWLIYNDGLNSWDIPTNLDPARRITSLEAVQLQEDIDTTNILNAVANAAAFANGSWVYALIAGKVLPNSPVFLVSFENASSIFQIGFISTITAFIQSITFSDPDVTVTTNIPHGLTVGDVVVIANATNGANNGEFIVKTITSNLIFIADNPNGVAQAGVAGQTENKASVNGGDAKFIKRSGDTFAQEGVANEIGVFAMTGLGL